MPEVGKTLDHIGCCEVDSCECAAGRSAANYARHVDNTAKFTASQTRQLLDLLREAQQRLLTCAVMCGSPNELKRQIAKEDGVPLHPADSIELCLQVASRIVSLASDIMLQLED